MFSLSADIVGTFLVLFILLSPVIGVLSSMGIWIGFDSESLSLSMMVNGVGVFCVPLKYGELSCVSGVSDVFDMESADFSSVYSSAMLIIPLSWLFSSLRLWKVLYRRRFCFLYSWC